MNLMSSKIFKIYRPFRAGDWVCRVSESSQKSILLIARSQFYPANIVVRFFSSRDDLESFLEFLRHNTFIDDDPFGEMI